MLSTLKLLRSLSAMDLRSTYRDPIFKGLLFFPFVAFLLVRFVAPLLLNRYPEWAEYAPLIVMWACMQSATMFGFIYGFLILEEKEENVFAALQIIPVSAQLFIGSRLLLGLLVSSAVNFCILWFGGIVQLPLWMCLLCALQFSLLAPLLSLLMGVLAKNKIEGMAQMKIFNLLLNLPILIYFLPYKGLHATALLPTYWSFRSIEAGLAGENFWLFYGGGCLSYLLCLSLLHLYFVRRVSS